MSASWDGSISESVSWDVVSVVVVVNKKKYNIFIIIAVDRSLLQGVKLLV